MGFPLERQASIRSDYSNHVEPDKANAWARGWDGCPSPFAGYTFVFDCVLDELKIASSEET
jgi:hypothetical protein